MGLYDKPLPHNQDAENAVVGGVILFPNLLEHAVDLQSDDFYHPHLRSVWDAIRELEAEGTEIDPVVIMERIDNQHVTISWLMGLTVGVDTIVSKFKSHVSIIKGHAIKRKLLFAVVKIERDILEGESTAGTIVQELESKVMSLNDRLVSKVGDDVGFAKLYEIVPEMAEQFARYHEGVATGVPTGMPEIDDMLDGGGLQNGAMYVIGAGEKVGKTSLVLDWSEFTATVTKKRVLIATLEMAKITMAKRLFSKHTGIAYHKFRPGFKDTARDKSYSQAFEEMESFGKIPIEIADNLFGLSQIALYFRRAVEAGFKSGKPEDEVGLGFIDYLQLIGDDTGQSVTTREREIAKISRRIRMLSIELGIPFIVISNLNREGLGAITNQKGQTEAQRPSTRNLRDSGAIGFDAEAVMFLHNPAFIPGKPYQPMPHTPIEFIMDRQRNGPTGTVPLMFIGEYMQFMTEKQYRAFMNDPVAVVQQPTLEAELVPEPPALTQGSMYYGDDGLDDED